MWNVLNLKSGQHINNVASSQTRLDQAKPSLAITNKQKISSNLKISAIQSKIAFLTEEVTTNSRSHLNFKWYVFFSWANQDLFVFRLIFRKKKQLWIFFLIRKNRIETKNQLILHDKPEKNQLNFSNNLNFKISETKTNSKQKKKTSKNALKKLAAWLTGMVDQCWHCRLTT